MGFSTRFGLAWPTLFSLAAGLLEGTKDCPWSPLQPSSTDIECAAPWSSQTWFHAGGWEGPDDCFQEDYCIYTNRNLNGGLAVISSEKSMHGIASHSLYPPDVKQEVGPGAFYPAQVPGKGIGLIANRTIRKGEIIMQRTPCLLVEFDSEDSELAKKARKESYEKALARLPDATRELFMAQIGDDVVAKVDRNAFRLFLGDNEGHVASYPEVSRFNHDCRPNLHYRLKNLTHTTVAVRDIEKGEELTISYIEGMIPYAERQERLESWGFKCACDACKADSALEIAASDGHLKEIERIEAELEEKIGNKEDIETDTPDRLIKLYLDEKLDSYVAHAYTKAALLSSMFGDEEKTTRYAMLAVEALEREYGPNTKDAESMLGLAEKPTEHWSWGIRAVGWKTVKVMQ
ncbi:hypothetical protein B0H66DRAFT_542503 [Apodospora peruviana]|uniref:SET domain-containing protein n=1 Tax=Apodospora peruviana TaxID=516989 RepID=A0AAE0IS62_9PEZI|nr:hypothetical protein B0H66DRAFT_542503 [Apodospora peruviana]